MKTTLQFLSLSIHDSWYPVLEQHLDHWQRLTAASATEVVMEGQREDRPTFRVQVSLKGSGPDLHTEAKGHTINAVLLEATQNLERQIQACQTQRVERRASESQLSVASGS